MEFILGNINYVYIYKKIQSIMVDYGSYSHLLDRLFISYSLVDSSFQYLGNFRRYTACRAKGLGTDADLYCSIY